MGSRHKGRILALQALYAYEMNNISPEEVLEFEWLNGERREKIQQDTLLFAQLLVKGTLDHLEEIDTAIRSCLEHWDFKRISKVDLAILRISIYALRYQDDIPSTVTINEAIDLAKEFSGDDAYRFVNGILDSIKKVRPE